MQFWLISFSFSLSLIAANQRRKGQQAIVKQLQLNVVDKEKEEEEAVGDDEEGGRRTTTKTKHLKIHTHTFCRQCSTVNSTQKLHSDSSSCEDLRNKKAKQNKTKIKRKSIKIFTSYINRHCSHAHLPTVGTVGAKAFHTNTLKEFSFK